MLGEASAAGSEHAGLGCSSESFHMEEMIYIAVGKDYNPDKCNLLFVLQRFPGPIGILHVHSPSKLRPILGARMPEKFAREDVNVQHKRREKEKMLKLLRSYATLCSEREENHLATGRLDYAMQTAGGGQLHLEMNSL
ncbi:U-box domain-containing protein 33-like isoform X2 [Panicum virgatum]|uniref:U-box domain-containing protein 33-like isoform X2 n=1 Tax=Panicum virgatum TaxID=38727 RepID=UPI0019D61D33|nr:U-box domain-containing protein 33-like isoform X2 [Panicum virgatum]